MNLEFRPRQSIKCQTAALTASFLVIIAISWSVCFLSDPIKQGFRDERSAVILGGFSCLLFGVMLVGSILQWVSYYREKTSICDTHLRLRRLGSTLQIDLDEITSLSWPSAPGSRVIIKTARAHGRIDLGNYARDDRLAMIRALRDLVLESRQDNWPLFCYQVALPLHEGKPRIAILDPSAEFWTITRWRYDRALAIALPLSCVFAIGAAYLWSLWAIFVLPFLVVGAWLLLRFNIPKEGRQEVRMRSTQLGRFRIRILWYGLAYFVLMAVTRVLSARFETIERIHFQVVAYLSAASLIAIMWTAIQADRQLRSTNREGSALAVAKWAEAKRMRKTRSV